MRSPAPSLIPVRCGRHCSRIRVADGEHVDPPAVGCGGLGPAAACSLSAPLRCISGPRGRRPHAEVPLVLSERHVPARVPGACGRGASARGSNARDWLLALEVRVVVQGQRHGHVGAVQLVPAPRQAAEAADAGPRHAGPASAARLPALPGRAAPACGPAPAALPAPPQPRPWPGDRHPGSEDWAGTALEGCRSGAGAGGNEIGWRHIPT